MKLRNFISSLLEGFGATSVHIALMAIKHRLGILVGDAHDVFDRDEPALRRADDAFANKSPGPATVSLGFAAYGVAKTEGERRGRDRLCGGMRC